jgi:hypothetical protein
MKTSLLSKILPLPQAVILFLVFVGCAILPLGLAAVAYRLHSAAAAPSLSQASNQSPLSTGSQHHEPGHGVTGLTPASNHSQGHPKFIAVGPETSAIHAAEAAERPSFLFHPDGK